MNKSTAASISLVLLAAAACQKVNKNDAAPSKDDPAELGLVDTNHATGHRMLVLEGVAAARSAGKLLLVKDAGAWCQPCAKLEHEMTNDPAYLEVAPNFIRVELEEITTERPIMDDALPAEVVSFPSFTVFDPRVNSWFRFSESTSHRVVEILNRLIAGRPPTFDEALAELTAYFADGGTFVDPDEDSYYHYWLVNNAVGNSAANDDKATYEAHLAQLKQLDDQYAAQIKHPWFESTFNFNAGVALSTGKWTLSDVDAQGAALLSEPFEFNEAYYQVADALRHLMAIGVDGYRGCEGAFEQRLASYPNYDDKVRRKVKTRCTTENLYAGLIDAAAAAEVTATMAQVVESGEQPKLARDIAWLLLAQGRTAEAADYMEKARVVAVDLANSELKDWLANTKLREEWRVAAQDVVTRVDAGYTRLANVLRSGSLHPGYDYAKAQ